MMPGEQASAGAMGSRVVLACPRCGYDRTGLDAAWACPECGSPAEEVPKLLAGTVTQADLSALSWNVMAAAWLGLAGVLFQYSAYVCSAAGDPALSSVLIVAFAALESGAAVCIAAAIRVIQRLGVHLDRAARYGTIVVVLRVLVALTVTLFMAVVNVGGIDSLGRSGILGLFGVIAAGPAIMSVQAVFARNMVRGVARGRRRLVAGDYALATIVASVAIMLISVGWLTPVAALLGAGFNILIARIFSHSVRDCRETVG